LAGAERRELALILEAVARQKLVLKMPEAALTTLEDAARRGDDTSVMRRLQGIAWNEVAVVRIRERDPHGAAAALERALLLAPDEAEIHLNLGLLAWDAFGEFDRAERHLREARRLRPAYRDALTALAALLASRGRWAEAAAHWRDVLAIDPDNNEARQGLAAARARAP
jgi:tetratricopeptide (TPR) repeat protein